MEIFTTKVQTDLNGVLQMTQMINGIMMTGDNAANEILVELYRGFNRIELDTNSETNKIIGYFIRPDGVTLEVDGTIENNTIRVVIPEAAYQVSGALSIAIRMLQGPYTAQKRGYYAEGTDAFFELTDPNAVSGPNGEEIVYQEYVAWNRKIVVAALNCFIQLTETDSILDPTHHIPDVQELLSYIAVLDQKQYQIGQAEEARVDAESLRVSAESTRNQTFTDNETVRQTTFETNETARAQEFTGNETVRQTTFETNETARETAESIRVQQESARVSAESTRVQQESARETAQAARNAKIDNMDVAFVTLPAYSQSYVNITEEGNDHHKLITFHIAPGDPFHIARTFSSISAMEAAYSDSTIRVGQFVVISTASVEDPDNGKLYLKTDSQWAFISDMSGARGATGNGISNTELLSDGKLRITFTDGTTYTTPISIIGESGVGGASFSYNENQKRLDITFY